MEMLEEMLKPYGERIEAGVRKTERQTFRRYTHITCAAGGQGKRKKRLVCRARARWQEKI